MGGFCREEIREERREERCEERHERHHGMFTSTGAILVLFILLVIITRSFLI